MHAARFGSGPRGGVPKRADRKCGAIKQRRGMPNEARTLPNRWRKRGGPRAAVPCRNWASMAARAATETSFEGPMAAVSKLAAERQRGRAGACQVARQESIPPQDVGHGGRREGRESDGHV
ncbi:hypothetical protein B0H10DRAFT_2095093 [Mycena sp. CBHHK59/15]|nr:hypothetical protein B0H10DRAFT_2095093 [Mycena sp. CBHHK59/15]